MKFFAQILFTLAALIKSVASYFAAADLDALALELEAEEEGVAINQQERERYEQQAMKARITQSELTRSNVSRRLEGDLVDVWIEPKQENAHL